ncbi:hypothetical protein LINPERPRIM_LOCUS1829 [Linum perenne]
MGELRNSKQRRGRNNVEQQEGQQWWEEDGRGESSSECGSGQGEIGSISRGFEDEERDIGRDQVGQETVQQEVLF